MSKSFSIRYIKTDLYLSMFVLLLFSSLFFVGRFRVLENNILQRYEIFILKINPEITCENCEISKDISLVDKVLSEANPKLKYSLLTPEWGGRFMQLISLSVVSSETINILEIYNKIAKQEKCHSEMMQVEFNKFKVEDWGKVNGNGKGCNVFFIYERKL